MKQTIRIYLIALFSIIGSCFCHAQNTAIVLDVTSFGLIQQDALTGVSIDKIGKDRSNRECARIKLHLNRMTPEEVAQVDVHPVGGNVIVMKKTIAYGGNGIIFELTARPGVRFYITHPALGESNTITVDLEGNREYSLEGWSEQKYSVTVECDRTGAEVYLDGTYRGIIGADRILTLTAVAVGDHIVKIKDGTDETEQKINVSMSRIFFPLSLESHQQYVVFQVTPPHASVEFDGMVLDVVDGAAFANKHFGTYEYTVRAPKYHTFSGSVIVNDLINKHIVNVNLMPAYGWIEIPSRTDTDGADVYLDNEYIGKAPLKSKEIASGEHSLRITKPMYKPFQSTVTVRDNETSEVSATLTANFANVTLEVADGAEIWVNGSHKGNGRWTGALTSGPNRIETKKANHRSQVMSHDITPAMDGETITLKSPEAILGTLVVESTPPISDVYIDGKLFSQTPVRTQLLTGSHQVRISRKGYKDYETSVTVVENQTATVSHTMTAASAGQPVRKKTEVKPSQDRKQNTVAPEKESEKENRRHIDGKTVLIRWYKWEFEPYIFTGKFWLNDSFPESGSFSGWEAGVMARYNFNGYLGLQAGLAFNTYTAGSDRTTSQLPDYTEVTFHNLRLPVQLTASLRFTSDIRIILEAGAYAGYAVGGKIRYTMEGTDGGIISDGTYPLFPEEEVSQAFNRFDMGLQFGAKFYIFGVGIGCSHIMGLNHFAKSPSIGSQTRAFGLSVSYAF